MSSVATERTPHARQAFRGECLVRLPDRHIDDPRGCRARAFGWHCNPPWPRRSDVHSSGMPDPVPNVRRRPKPAGCGSIASRRSTGLRICSIRASGPFTKSAARHRQPRSVIVWPMNSKHCESSSKGGWQNCPKPCRPSRWTMYGKGNHHAVGGKWQWLVQREGRDMAEGAARAVADAKREAEGVALKLG